MALVLVEVAVDLKAVVVKCEVFVEVGLGLAVVVVV